MKQSDKLNTKKENKICCGTATSPRSITYRYIYNTIPLLYTAEVLSEEYWVHENANEGPVNTKGVHCSVPTLTETSRAYYIPIFRVYG